MQELGARLVIAESSAVGVDSEKVIQESGYQELREIGYAVADLKKNKKAYVTLPSENGKVFDLNWAWMLN